MKLELPCAIVRDLLPSYVEELTEAETTAAVKEHLETCEDCRKRWEAMSEGQAPADDGKEVDYLKHVRKKNTKKIVGAVALAVALVLVGVGAKLFWIGSPCDGSSVAVEVTLSGDGGRLALAMEEMNSGSTLRDIRVDREGELFRITGREVLVSPFRRAEPAALDLPLVGVKRVEVFGRTVWQDGLVITPYIDRLMGLKIPYVGNASAVGALISGMDLDSPATLELQTGAEPYGVTLHFGEIVREDRRWLVEQSAYLLLALVDNLGQVTWDDPSGYTDSLTLTEADQALPGLVEAYNQLHGTQLRPLESVKDYAEHRSSLQQLHELLDA